MKIDVGIVDEKKFYKNLFSSIKVAQIVNQ